MPIMYVGCKMNNISVVYTPFTNLKKTQGMDVGQVGFHDQKKVHYILMYGIHIMVDSGILIGLYCVSGEEIE